MDRRGTITDAVVTNMISKNHISSISDVLSFLVSYVLGLIHVLL